MILWLLPITRYRLTGAFFGGIWALAPDIRKLLDGSLAARIETVHDSQLADVFFLHHMLDQPFVRDNEFVFTFLALATLGGTLLLYDWRFGQRTPPVRLFGSSTDTSRTESK
jgi:hypothetical protein